MAARIGFYPGSFDPLTNGHVDILRAALNICDKIVVGIGVHPGKVPLFSAVERTQMISAAIGSTAAEIVTFDGLVVEAAQAHHAHILIRGLRDGTDFDYEMQMAGMNAQLVAGMNAQLVAGMNAQLSPTIETIFIPAKVESRHITATLVRQIAAMGGDISAFVPPNVAAAFAARRNHK